MRKIISLIKKFIPKPAYGLYHFSLAFLGALIYGFPSRKMKVIGVIGTKGKTTTANLIAQILNKTGHKAGMATTVNFRIGDKEWINETKQTMLGRFKLQKLLRQMAKENCEYAIVETSSEGILQFRHRFIDYDAAVFTNITPEHLERHGGFENYRRAKVKLFEKVAEKPDGIGIYNLDDPNVEYFLKPGVKNKYGYGKKIPNNKFQIPNNFQISNIKLFPDKSGFDFNSEHFKTKLIGEFNIYNAAATITLALSQNIPVADIKKAIAEAVPPPGRMEIIKSNSGFSVVVDYAHEPASLEAIYKTLTSSNLRAQGSKLICLLGAQGGGRDKWKRSAMGKIAGEYCDEIILTNEDPYDENPLQIITDVEGGFSQIPNNKFQITKNYWKVIDRKEAIKKALSLAQKDDVVVLTGKGGEVWMCVENGRKIPWDEKRIVENLLKD
ncbi:MAG: UDP-N-acetylmuramoyl-L-alanyl-D-glutamate--2,6-diaminopimelate ligase [Candidatus Wolfebacteria bacterium]|nr:UDP-N-acetylmuramoyl-L-alanyl-D-glutamate--2,6-diaminopimelate ligase [Candidatus Wolfebacteria bacterium]